MYCTYSIYYDNDEVLSIVHGLILPLYALKLKEKWCEIYYYYFDVRRSPIVRIWMKLEKPQINRSSEIQDVIKSRTTTFFGKGKIEDSFLDFEPGKYLFRVPRNNVEFIAPNDHPYIGLVSLPFGENLMTAISVHFVKLYQKTAKATDINLANGVKYVIREILLHIEDMKKVKDSKLVDIILSSWLDMVGSWKSQNPNTSSCCIDLKSILDVDHNLTENKSLIVSDQLCNTIKSFAIANISVTPLNKKKSILTILLILVFINGLVYSNGVSLITCVLKSIRD